MKSIIITDTFLVMVVTLAFHARFAATTAPNHDEVISNVEFLEDQVADLELQMTTQERAVELMKYKDQANHMFVATHGQAKDEYKEGEAMLFDNVVVNDGVRYNTHHRRFQADLPGFYLFHISVVSKPGKWVYVDIVQPYKGVLARIRAGTKVHSIEYSKGSCIVQLEAGSAVRAVVSRIDDGGKALYLGYNQSTRLLTRFDGVLLRAL